MIKASIVVTSSHDWMFCGVIGATASETLGGKVNPFNISTWLANQLFWQIGFIVTLLFLLQILQINMAR